MKQSSELSKNGSKDCYFKMLEYSSIFAKQEQECNRSSEEASSRKRHKAYGKLWKMNTDKLRDSSCWRWPNIFDICQSEFDSNSNHESGQSQTDAYFWNDNESRAFRKFLKIAATPSSETGISLMIRFDGIMIVEMDSLADNIDLNHSKQDCQISTDKVLSDGSKTRPTVSSRGGTAQQVFLWNRKLLLPHAVRNLLCFR